MLQLWELCEARTWDHAAALLDDAFVAEWPNSGERIRGPRNFIDVQRFYPEGWRVEVLRVLGDGTRAAAEVRVPHGDDTFYCAGFYEVQDGLIRAATEYWSDGRPSDAPAWRARWVERL